MLKLLIINVFVIWQALFLYQYFTNKQESTSAMKLPVFFIAHGGPPNLYSYDSPSYKFWQSFGRRLLDDYIKPGHVKEILILSAHWESDGNVRVAANDKPSVIYDFYGFEEKLYREKYDCKGSPKLAARVQSLLKTASIDCDIDTTRGLDHGVWIPLKVMLPEAPVPIVPLSLKSSLDPAFHIKLGKALTALREEGVLIVGSGSSLHNLRKAFSSTANEPWAIEFEAKLTETLTTMDESKRNDSLVKLVDLQITKIAHPRIEHLIPVYFAAGAAASDRAKKIFEHYELPNLTITAFEFS